MVRVNELAEELRERGTGSVRIVASPSVGQALVPDAIARLRERFPDLRGHVDKMAVAIDDEIHNDAMFMPLEPNSEVHFVPRIGGG